MSNSLVQVFSIYISIFLYFLLYYPILTACDDSDLHAVQAGNLGAAMAGSLPSCL